MCSTLGKQLSLFARKSVVLLFHPQASVRFRCALHMYQSHLRRAKSQQLHRDTERTTAKTPRCAGIKENPKLFLLLSKQTCFFRRTSPLIIWRRTSNSAARPFLASSPLSIVKVDVSKISNRLPDYPTLKKNSLEMLSNKKEVL